MADNECMGDSRVSVHFRLAARAAVIVMLASFLGVATTAPAKADPPQPQGAIVYDLGPTGLAHWTDPVAGQDPITGYRLTVETQVGNDVVGSYDLPPDARTFQIPVLPQGLYWVRANVESSFGESQGPAAYYYAFAVPDALTFSGTGRDSHGHFSIRFNQGTSFGGPVGVGTYVMTVDGQAATPLWETVDDESAWLDLSDASVGVHTVTFAASNPAYTGPAASAVVDVQPPADLPGSGLVHFADAGNGTVITGGEFFADGGGLTRLHWRLDNGPEMVTDLTDKIVINWQKDNPLLKVDGVWMPRAQASHNVAYWAVNGKGAGAKGYVSWVHGDGPDAPDVVDLSVDGTLGWAYGTPVPDSRPHRQTQAVYVDGARIAWGLPITSNVYSLGHLSPGEHVIEVASSVGGIETFSAPLVVHLDAPKITSLVATRPLRDREVDLVWHDGHPASTLGYDVTVMDGTRVIQRRTFAKTVRTARLTGLPGGQLVRITVAARNLSGEQGRSVSARSWARVPTQLRLSGSTHRVLSIGKAHHVNLYLTYGVTGATHPLAGDLFYVYFRVGGHWEFASSGLTDKHGRVAADLYGYDSGTYRVTVPAHAVDGVRYAGSPSRQFSVTLR